MTQLSLPTMPARPSPLPADIEALLREARMVANLCRCLANRLETLGDPVNLRGEFKRNVRAMLWSEDPHCSYCRRRLSFARSTLDHIIPKVRGGDDTPENLCLACNGCNQEKSGRMPDEFAASALALEGGAA